MITVRQIEAFKAVMESDTVLQAARKMHLSQPSVSRLLADLESDIGYRLFARRKGRLVARRGADELYAEVERTFSGLSRISEAAKQIGRYNAGRLRVAVLPIFNRPSLARVVAQFLDRHPDAFISLNSRTRPNILEETASGRHDIALATLPVDRPEIGAQTIASTEYLCLVPERHPLSGREAIAPKDLEGVRLIGSADPSPGRHAIDRMLGDAGVDCTLRVETTTEQMALALVAEGVGVSVTLRAFAADLPDSCARPIPFRPRIPVDIAAIFPCERPPHGLAARFVEACAKALQALSGGEGMALETTRVLEPPVPAIP